MTLARVHRFGALCLRFGANQPQRATGATFKELAKSLQPRQGHHCEAGLTPEEVQRRRQEFDGQKKMAKIIRAAIK
jgi:hypothetical protein